MLEAQEQVEQTKQELEVIRSEVMTIEKKAAEWERRAEQLKVALEVEKVRVAELQKPAKRDSTPPNVSFKITSKFKIPKYFHLDDFFAIRGIGE